jgi:hypothetical protein
MAIAVAERVEQPDAGLNPTGRFASVSRRARYRKEHFTPRRGVIPEEEMGCDSPTSLEGPSELFFPMILLILMNR